MARCSTRGPCAAVRDRRQARRGIGRDADPFSPGQESGRKTRLALTDLPGRMPGKRQAGWPSLLVTFLLLRASCPPPFGPAALFARAPGAVVATQEKSDSVAAGDRPLFDLKTTKASRLKSLLQVSGAMKAIRSKASRTEPAPDTIRGSAPTVRQGPGWRNATINAPPATPAHAPRSLPIATARPGVRRNWFPNIPTSPSMPADSKARNLRGSEDIAPPRRKRRPSD